MAVKPLVAKVMTDSDLEVARPPESLHGGSLQLRLKFVYETVLDDFSVFDSYQESFCIIVPLGINDFLVGVNNNTEQVVAFL